MRIPDAYGSVQGFGDRPTPRPSAGVAPLSEDAVTAPGRATVALGEAMFRQGQELEDIARRETAKANVVRANDAANAGHDAINELTYGEQGYKAIQGKDTVGRSQPLIAEYAGRLDAEVGRIAGGLANPEQAELFRQRIAPAVILFKRGVLEHTAQEFQQYEREVNATTITQGRRDAIENWNDPEVVAVARARIDAAQAKLAGIEGWSDEKREAQRVNTLSDITAGVVDRLLANRQDTEAAAYYQRFKGSINPEIATKIEHALTVTNERHQAEADAERKARAAELTSDVEIAVRRGRAGYAQVEEAYRAGILTPAKRTELTVHLDKENQKASEAASAERAQLQRVQGALGGAGFLDFRSGDDRKAVDAYFGKVLAPSLAKAQLDPNQSAQTVAEFTARTGIMPTPIRETIRGALRAGDPAAKVQASDMLDRLKSANPRVVDDFATEDVRLGNLISTYTRAGVAPVDAVKMAQGALDVPKPELEAREQRYQHDKMAEKNQKTLAKEMSGFRFFSPSLPGKLPDAMLGEFETITRNEFQRTGDLEASQKTALDQLKRVWGVTQTGKQPGWMPYAPETVYGVPGEDPKWIRDQLQRDIRKGALIDKDAELSLAADSITARQGAPSYVVLNKDKNGVLSPLIGADGRPLRFRPDFGSSDAGARRQKALETLRDDAAMIMTPSYEPAPVTGRASRR